MGLIILSWLQKNQAWHSEQVWEHRELCCHPKAQCRALCNFFVPIFCKPTLWPNIVANQEWNHKVKKSVRGKKNQHICFDGPWPKCEINIRFAQFGVKKCLFILPRRRGDKGCSVWRDCGGFPGRQTHAWLSGKISLRCSKSGVFDDIRCKGADDKSVCNYSNILSVSSTQSLCHRPVTGFCCVQEAHFTSKVQLKLWPIRNIKIFHEVFWNCLGWKGPVVVPCPTPSCTGPA